MYRKAINTSTLINSTCQLLFMNNYFAQTTGLGNNRAANATQNTTQNSYQLNLMNKNMMA